MIKVRLKCLDTIPTKFKYMWVPNNIKIGDIIRLRFLRRWEVVKIVEVF